MALTELNSYTVHDIFDLPEGQRAELIDGRVYYMSPPTRTHQRIVGELFAMIREHIKRLPFLFYILSGMNLYPFFSCLLAAMR